MLIKGPIVCLRIPRRRGQEVSWYCSPSGMLTTAQAGTTDLFSFLITEQAISCWTYLLLAIESVIKEDQGRQSVVFFGGSL